MTKSTSAARRFSALRQAVSIGIFEQLEQRRMLSATPLGPIPYETQGSYPSATFVVGGTTLFFADDATGTQHLYKTDGTTAGTQLVDGAISNVGSGGEDAEVSGNNLFFVAESGSGEQVYEASVGTSVTVTQFTNISPDNGLDRYSIGLVTPVGSGVYFVVNDGNNSSSENTPNMLYVSDGTSSGTHALHAFAYVIEIADLNGTAIFNADDTSGGGDQLWVSDGTSGGTTPLPLSNGDTLTHPEDFVANGTNMFFGDGDGDLYMTDGTQAGTNEVTGYDEAEVNGTASENTDEHLSVLSGEVYFASDSYLYKTDGTTTTQVGTGNVYDVYDITPMGGNVYYSAIDDAHGRELWKSDGTTESLVGDINSGSGGSDPFNLTASGNQLFFEAAPNGDDDQIFTTDGTTVTQLTQAVGDGSDFENSISPGGNGVAYVSYNDGFHGNEPWKLTSTTASLLADVNSTPRDESQAPSSFAQVGNTIYFVSGDSGGEDNTLWKTDGTAAGTVEIGPEVTIASGDTTTNAALAAGETVSNLMPGTSVLYFESDADGTSNALWMYNGTTAAPVQYIPEVGSAPALGLISPADDVATPVDIQPGGNMAVVGNTLYFDFDDGVHGDELWKTDGTVAGTQLVKDINGVSGGDDSSSSPQNFEVLGSELLFTADDGLGAGRELWVSDGTATGTVAIKHLVPDTSSIDIEDFAVVNGTGYFTVGNDGTDLWKTDGTATGTMELGTFDDVYFPGYGSSDDTNAPPVIGGDFFFEATTVSGENYGYSLWKTDGTPAGTVVVKSEVVDGESGGLDPENLINLNPTTIVFEGDGPAGYELWKTDGTTAGTVQVADINTGEASSDPDNLVVLNGEVYFSATSGDTGAGPFDRELWKSDGTAAGTTEVKQIFTGTTSYYGDGPDFSPDTPDEGSDGADVYDTTIVGSKIFFNADDGIHGTELWETDGTAAGTFLVQDINPTGGSYPEDFTPIVTPTGDNALVFFADDGTTGDQPYSVIAPSYNLVVSSPTLSVPENGNSTFTVDLSSAPTSNVTVTISEESGGSSTLVASPLTLTFTPADYNVPQTVGVAGTLGTGSLDSTAIFDVSTGNLIQTVTATEIAPIYGLVVSVPTINVPENGSNTFTVALSAAPTANVTVTVAKASGGSTDLNASAGTLTFTPADWNTPQTVTVTGGIDDSALNSVATFDVSAQDVTTQSVAATETANATGILVVSSNAINVPEGGSTGFAVHLSSAPVGQLTVTISRTAGDSILSTAPATLVFTAANYNVDQTVTITSGVDADITDQTATFTVSAAGFPDQSVVATQLDENGPEIGSFSVSPSTGTSKSKIKLTASGATGDSGFGDAFYVVFYIDTNGDGVLDNGDATLHLVKPNKHGVATYSLKAKTLSSGVTTFFAAAEDAGGTVGQPVSGTFTLSANSAVKKAVRHSQPMIVANDTQSSDLSSDGIMQSLFSQTPILG
jgi:ELWxxDGT repeat protein